MAYDLAKTGEYLKWFESLASREKLQVDARLDRLAVEGHFGTWRYLGDKVSELKFNVIFEIHALWAWSETA